MHFRPFLRPNPTTTSLSLSSLPSSQDFFCPPGTLPAETELAFSPPAPYPAPTMKQLSVRFWLLNLDTHHCAASWSPSPGLELSPPGSRTSVSTSRLFRLLAVPCPQPGEWEGLCLMHLVCSWEREGRRSMIEVCPEVKKISVFKNPTSGLTRALDGSPSRPLPPLDCLPPLYFCSSPCK